MTGVLVFLRRFNWTLFVSMLVLVAIGTVAVWSAGNARTAVVFHGMWKAHLATAVVGLVAYFGLAATDYRRLLAFGAIPAYVIALVLLAAVLVVGTEQLGGRRWLWFFQPSEVAKVAVIALLAFVFGNVEGDGAPRLLSGFRGLLLAGALVGVPSALILREPDLGTTLVLVPAAVVMLLAAGVWRKGLLVLLAAGLTATLLLLWAVGEAERPGADPERRARILRYVPLRDHQLRRVRVFLYPEEDLTGDGYNYRQAMISIGSGGFSGKGIGKGESNHLKYLPPSISMNDFIFCVWAEETGFVGSLSLLGLFGMLVFSGAWVAFRSLDGSGRLLALGVSTLVFAHVFVNIAMSIGLVPITGLPLPFISAGRTFLLTIMVALGLVQSVSIYGRNT